MSDGLGGELNDTSHPIQPPLFLRGHGRIEAVWLLRIGIARRDPLCLWAVDAEIQLPRGVSESIALKLQRPEWMPKAWNTPGWNASSRPPGPRTSVVSAGRRGGWRSGGVGVVRAATAECEHQRQADERSACLRQRLLLLAEEELLVVLVPLVGLVDADDVPVGVDVVEVPPGACVTKSSPITRHPELS